MIRIIIHDFIRGGKNNMGVSRSGHHYPKRAWSYWRDKVVSEMAQQTLKDRFIKSNCAATIYYLAGDRRVRDIPAMVDSLFHCLERAGILENDSLIKKLSWVPLGFKRNKPRFEIELEEMKGFVGEK